MSNLNLYLILVLPGIALNLLVVWALGAFRWYSIPMAIVFINAGYFLGRWWGMKGVEK